MSSEPMMQPPVYERPSYSRSIGTIVLGLILVLIGLAWILEVSDVINLSLGVILPSALILVGVALVGASLSGSHGGLITVGILLTLVLTVSAAVNVPINGGAGDRSFTPTQVTSLSDGYQLMAGNLKLDLTEMDLPAGETTVTAKVGIGQL